MWSFPAKVIRSRSRQGKKAEIVIFNNLSVQNWNPFKIAKRSRSTFCTLVLGIVLICAEEKYELKTDYENCVESQGESNCEGSGINIMNKLVEDIYTGPLHRVRGYPEIQIHVWFLI